MMMDVSEGIVTFRAASNCWNKSHD
ncbi:unnamed protein product [Lathyrus sativus]|nr:unnamed protein product [Lathyrus sativus]